MDPEAQNIGRDELMVMIVIALGCGFVFITLAFIIVAMVKRGRPSDDEFERYNLARRRFSLNMVPN